MSWQFDKSFNLVSQNKNYESPICSSVNDFDSGVKYIKVPMGYVPTSSSGLNILSFIRGESKRYTKNNCYLKLLYNITYTPATLYVSSKYTLSVESIQLEFPLPVPMVLQCSVKLSLAANKKSFNNIVFNVSNTNGKFPISFSATYNGVTVSSKTTLISTTSGSTKKTIKGDIKLILEKE